MYVCSFVHCRHSYHPNEKENVADLGPNPVHLFFLLQLKRLKNSEEKQTSFYDWRMYYVEESV